MDEKIREIVDKYSFHVDSVSRGRGAFICSTDEGPRIVREYFLAPSRLVFESLVKYTIRDRGYMNVDQIVVNRDGELVTKNRYDKNYVVKEWFEGRECDTRSREDLLALTVNLAKLHKVMSWVPISPDMAGKYCYGSMKSLLERHCRELRAIRNYMKNRKQKKDFENLYLQYYDEFEVQALAAENRIENCGYGELIGRALEERTLCHGDYNHHNVILMKKGDVKSQGGGHDLTGPVMATVNFDKMNINIQVNDLYLFLRKVMEKNNWNVTLGISIVEAYDRERPLSREEKNYLYILMLFPEKFWKIANHYYNTRKSWTSGRNQEKLEAFIRSREVRKDFLQQFYDRLCEC